MVTRWAMSRLAVAGVLVEIGGARRVNCLLARILGSHDGLFLPLIPSQLNIPISIFQPFFAGRLRVVKVTVH